MHNLNPNRIPKALTPLLQVAEKWGVGDDYEREALVNAASEQELENLIHSIDCVSDDDLFGWLSGPESYNVNPTKEYLAFTALTMAIDYAKLALRKRKTQG